MVFWEQKTLERREKEGGAGFPLFPLKDEGSGVESTLFVKSYGQRHGNHEGEIKEIYKFIFRVNLKLKYNFCHIRLVWLTNLRFFWMHHLMIEDNADSDYILFIEHYTKFIAMNERRRTIFFFLHHAKSKQLLSLFAFYFTWLSTKTWFDTRASLKEKRRGGLAPQNEVTARELCSTLKDSENLYVLMSNQHSLRAPGGGGQ